MNTIPIGLDYGSNYGNWSPPANPVKNYVGDQVARPWWYPDTTRNNGQQMRAPVSNIIPSVAAAPQAPVTFNIPTFAQPAAPAPAQPAAFSMQRPATIRPLVADGYGQWANLDQAQQNMAAAELWRTVQADQTAKQFAAAQDQQRFGNTLAGTQLGASLAQAALQAKLTREAQANTMNIAIMQANQRAQEAQAQMAQNQQAARRQDIAQQAQLAQQARHADLADRTFNATLAPGGLNWQTLDATNENAATQALREERLGMQGVEQNALTLAQSGVKPDTILSSMLTQGYFDKANTTGGQPELDERKFQAFGKTLEDISKEAERVKVIRQTQLDQGNNLTLITQGQKLMESGMQLPSVVSALKLNPEQATIMQDVNVAMENQELARYSGILNLANQVQMLRSLEAQSKDEEVFNSLTPAAQTAIKTQIKALKPSVEANEKNMAGIGIDPATGQVTLPGYAMAAARYGWNPNPRTEADIKPAGAKVATPELLSPYEIRARAALQRLQKVPTAIDPTAGYPITNPNPGVVPPPNFTWGGIPLPAGPMLNPDGTIKNAPGVPVQVVQRRAYVNGQLVPVNR